MFLRFKNFIVRYIAKKMNCSKEMILEIIKINVKFLLMYVPTIFPFLIMWICDDFRDSFVLKFISIKIFRNNKYLFFIFRAILELKLCVFFLKKFFLSKSFNLDKINDNIDLKRSLSKLLGPIMVSYCIDPITKKFDGREYSIIEIWKKIKYANFGRFCDIYIENLIYSLSQQKQELDYISGELDYAISSSNEERYEELSKEYNALIAGAYFALWSIEKMKKRGSFAGFVFNMFKFFAFFSVFNIFIFIRPIGAKKFTLKKTQWIISIFNIFFILMLTSMGIGLDLLIIGRIR